MASLGYSHRRLVNLLGPERVARGEMERLIHSHDFAAVPKPAYLNFKLVPDFVVLPRTAEEVSRIVQFAIEADTPVVPRGGGTGFYGGGVASRGGILIDFRRMRRAGFSARGNRKSAFASPFARRRFHNHRGNLLRPPEVLRRGYAPPVRGVRTSRSTSSAPAGEKGSSPSG